MAQNASGKTTRRVELHPIGSSQVAGFIAKVVLTHFTTRGGWEHPSHEETVGKYAFALLNDDAADNVSGLDTLDSDGSPVAYVGRSLGKHYFQSKPWGDVPVDVFEKLTDEGYSLIENVEGGWRDWDGRPEWSTTFMDATDSETVDIQTVINERRSEDE